MAGPAFAKISGRENRAFVTETVDSGLIPG